MRPNFIHSSSSSISRHQQQRNNNGIPALFPYNQQQLSDEGTSFHRPHLELVNMESLSSPSTTRLINYNEEDEIGDHVVVLGRALDAAAEEGGGGQLQTALPLPLEKEHMFDKVVTPSDVGKLNRLVIPKQHAEKYFPLDSSTNEKGLLLNFEDRNGKPWRFRYSYWNSSQSYVMTKGWSRFVKDKKLDAGDIVSFSRGVGELGKDSLFIDWRRRPTAPPSLPLLPPPPAPGHQYYSFHPWNHPYFLQQQRCRDNHPSSSQQHPHHQINYNPRHQSSTTSSYGGGYGGGLMNGNPLIYFRSPIPQQQQQIMVPNNSGAGICSMMQMQRAGGAVAIEEDIIHDPMVFESVPVVQGKAAAKRLRLFGVNMDCPITPGASISGDDVETDIILSSTAVHHHDHPAANPSPSRNFYSSSSSSSSIRAHPYNVGGPVQQRKMYCDNKGKGSLSLDFDV